MHPRSYELRALRKQKPLEIGTTRPQGLKQTNSTRASQHKVRPTWPQESGAIRARLSAAEWKSLYYVTLYYRHELLSARSLIGLFRGHPEWRHA